MSARTHIDARAPIERLHHCAGSVDFASLHKKGRAGKKRFRHGVGVNGDVAALPQRFDRIIGVDGAAPVDERCGRRHDKREAERDE
jgi:hypothetical protein